MTDLSPALSALLAIHNARLAPRPFTRSTTTDKFLHEAYVIDSNIASITDYLSSSRQSYLSTSAPPRTRTRHNTTQEREYLTDSQRDEIDSESKATLSKLATRIQDLEAAEHTRRQAVTLTASKRKKYGLGRLGAWAAGDVGGTSAKSPEESLVEAREAHLAECRDSVVWYLRLKLEGAMGKQREMMERRMEREVERGKSVLHKIKGSSDTGVTGEGGALVDGRGTGNSSTTNTGALKDLYGRDGGTGYVGSAVSLDEKDRKGIEQSLSPEQLQLFEQENNDMLNRYNDQIGQVRQAESSMNELLGMYTTINMHLAVQKEWTDVLVENAMDTEENVTSGNKQLKQAASRWRPARTVFMATCGLCTTLVLWDLLI